MIAGLLAHPFRDTALLWTSNGRGVVEATFNANRIGGYGLRGDVCGRVWFGNTVRVEPFDEVLTEAGARAWIEATFREWVRLALPFAAPTAGDLINERARAGAAVVDAQEALARIPQRETLLREIATGRVWDAREVERKALKAERAGVRQ